MISNKKTNSTYILQFTPYPKYITIPEVYFTSTPDNVVYISKCKKCNKTKEIK